MTVLAAGGALRLAVALAYRPAIFYNDSFVYIRHAFNIGGPGLVTFAPDDIDWDEEIRIAIEERASFSPDALTGLEANYRFAGPETMETKIFGRLSAWQNWIFNRPNAVGPDGALRRFGTGQRAVFDRKRV